MTDRPPHDDDPFADLSVSWLREADLVDDWADPEPVVSNDPSPAPPPAPEPAAEPEPEPVAAIPEPEPEPLVAPEVESVVAIPEPGPEPEPERVAEPVAVIAEPAPVLEEAATAPVFEPAPFPDEPPAPAPVAEPEPAAEPEPVAKLEPVAYTPPPEREPEPIPEIIAPALPDWTTPSRALDEPVAPTWEPADVDEQLREEFPHLAFDQGDEHAPAAVAVEPPPPPPPVEAPEPEVVEPELQDDSFVFDPSAFMEPERPDSPPVAPLTRERAPREPQPQRVKPQKTMRVRQQPRRPLRRDGRQRRSFVALAGIILGLGIAISVVLIGVIGAITLIVDRALG